MAKAKIDRLLDKPGNLLTSADVDYIIDYYEKKGFENLDVHEANYLYIAKEFKKAEAKQVA